MRTTTRPTKANLLLWIIQGLLAALFLFAGGMKFVMPVAEMTKGTVFSGDFIHFIGAAEVLGALGVILPAATKVHRELVVLAALGLLTIIVGAVTTTLEGPQAAGAIVPAVAGVLCALVAYGRRGYLRASSGSTLSVLQPTA
jgi:hypothetical protein